MREKAGTDDKIGKKAEVGMEDKENKNRYEKR